MRKSYAHKQLKERFDVNHLLAEPDDNPKLAKSLKMRVLSRPLHLAPARLSGWNVCPMATRGCEAACLHTAGNPAFMKGKMRARLARTRAYFEARDLFILALWHEINEHRKAARKLRMKPAVRLNATSDIMWERIPVMGLPNIMACFPDVAFYDYTKIAKRVVGSHPLPPNYHLTFSLADGNMADAVEAYFSGCTNVAVVFDTPRGKPLPAMFKLGAWNVRVIDGDLHDYRPADPRGVIVGLRAKGRARHDASGFVVRAGE